MGKVRMWTDDNVDLLLQAPWRAWLEVVLVKVCWHIGHLCFMAQYILSRLGRKRKTKTDNKRFSNHFCCLFSPSMVDPRAQCVVVRYCLLRVVPAEKEDFRPTSFVSSMHQLISVTRFPSRHACLDWAAYSRASTAPRGCYAEPPSQASAGAGLPGDKVVIALHFNKSHTEDTRP